MKRVIIYSFILIISINLTFSNSYPIWFIYPRLYPSYIIGFSYNGNSALTDAEIMYCVYKNCRVEGYFESFTSNEINYLQNSNYFYVYNNEELKKIKGKLFKIDGFGVSAIYEDVIEIYCLNKNCSIDYKRIEPENIQKPNWLQKFCWIENGYYYGVGKFTSVNNTNDSWKTSEEQAIYNIITSISIKVHSITRSEEIENYKSSNINYVKTYVKFNLYNIETLERYPDLQNNIFYTLVRINQKDIISEID